MREYFDGISIGGLLFGDGWLRWEGVFGYYQNKSKFEGEGEEMQALRMWWFFSRKGEDAASEEPMELKIGESLWL